MNWSTLNGTPVQYLIFLHKRYEGIHQFNFIFLEMKSSSMYSITGTEALIYLLILFPADWSAENIEKHDWGFQGSAIEFQLL